MANEKEHSFYFFSFKHSGFLGLRWSCFFCIILKVIFLRIPYTSIKNANINIVINLCIVFDQVIQGTE